MTIAETRFETPLARKHGPRRWPAITLALLLTPGLGFLLLSHVRLATFYLFYAFGCVAVFAFLFFLDLDLLRNMPYAFVYALMVNVAGALHAASVPLKPRAQAPSRWYNNLVAVLSLPVLVVMLVYTVLTVAPTYRMPSPSMEPTLALNRPFLVLLPAYRWFEPERGQIVLYRSRSEIGEISRLSRIIGLPGDTVAMEDGIPVLNGMPLFRRRLPDYDLKEGARVAATPCFMEVLPDGTHYSVLEKVPGHSGRFDNRPAYRVPEGSYFVISDNRDQARDSRDMRGVGLVPREALLGQAIALQMTPSARQAWRDRWERMWGLVGL
jgi:signal peptidase I